MIHSENVLSFRTNHNDGAWTGLGTSGVTFLPATSEPPTPVLIVPTPVLIVPTPQPTAPTLQPTPAPTPTPFPQCGSTPERASPLPAGYEEEAHISLERKCCEVGFNSDDPYKRGNCDSNLEGSASLGPCFAIPGLWFGSYQSSARGGLGAEIYGEFQLGFFIEMLESRGRGLE